MDDDCVLVHCTAPADIADALAVALVDARLVACASLVPGLVSVYRWEGRIERAQETLLVAKTLRSRVPALTARLLTSHPYAVPELIVTPIVDGLPAYLDWIRQSCASSD